MYSTCIYLYVPVLVYCSRTCTYEYGTSTGPSTVQGLTRTVLGTSTEYLSTSTYLYSYSACTSTSTVLSTIGTEY